MAAPLYFVRPDEDWAKTASMSATSFQVGYEAINARDDDPAQPWWADSTTATLTATLTGSKEVGVIAIVMTNADDAKVITLGGSASGTLTGKREASGYPRDLALIISPPVNMTSVTFAIASNANKWSIGKVVIGKLRSIRNLGDGMTTLPVRSFEADPGIPTLGHDVRYDTGAEHWKVDGSVLLSYADYVIANDWYFSTKMGFHPTLVIVDADRYPPIYARMTQGDRVTKERNVQVPMSFLTVGRGLELVG